MESRDEYWPGWPAGRARPGRADLSRPRAERAENGPKIHFCRNRKILTFLEILIISIGLKQ